MSRRAPDTVHTIRFELQDHERKLLDTYVNAEMVKDYADAFNLITSFENMYVVVTIIEIVTGKEILPGTPNDVLDIIDAIKDARKKGRLDQLADFLAELPTVVGFLYGR
jgi:hypothetical protein